MICQIITIIRPGIPAISPGALQPEATTTARPSVVVQKVNKPRRACVACISAAAHSLGANIGGASQASMSLPMAIYYTFYTVGAFAISAARRLKRRWHCLMNTELMMDIMQVIAFSIVWFVFCKIGYFGFTEVL